MERSESRPRPANEGENAAPPRATSGRVAVACTYCRGSLDRREAVYCAACLAPQHADCFATHGKCSVQGCGETRSVRPAPGPTGTSRALRNARLRFAALAVVAALGWLAAFSLREASFREREAPPTAPFVLDPGPLEVAHAGPAGPAPGTVPRDRLAAPGPPVSLSIEKLPLADACEELGRRADVTVLVAPERRRTPVSFSGAARLDGLLDALAWQAGADVVVLPGGTRVVMALAHVTIPSGSGRSALETIAGASGEAMILVAPDAQDALAREIAPIENLPWPRALERLLALLGLRAIRHGGLIVVAAHPLEGWGSPVLDLAVPRAGDGSPPEGGALVDLNLESQSLARTAETLGASARIPIEAPPYAQPSFTIHARHAPWPELAGFVARWCELVPRELPGAGVALVEPATLPNLFVGSTRVGALADLLGQASGEHVVVAAPDRAVGPLRILHTAPADALRALALAHGGVRVGGVEGAAPLGSPLTAWATPVVQLPDGRTAQLALEATLVLPPGTPLGPRRWSWAIVSGKAYATGDELAGLPGVRLGTVHASSVELVVGTGLEQKNVELALPD